MEWEQIAARLEHLELLVRDMRKDLDHEKQDSREEASLYHSELEVIDDRLQHVEHKVTALSRGGF